MKRSCVQFSGTNHLLLPERWDISTARGANFLPRGEASATMKVRSFANLRNGTSSSIPYALTVCNSCSLSHISGLTAHRIRQTSSVSSLTYLFLVIWLYQNHAVQFAKWDEIHRFRGWSVSLLFGASYPFMLSHRLRTSLQYLRIPTFSCPRLHEMDK